MYVIIWEFQSKAGREAEFEQAYGPGGVWVEFFKRGEGYIGTELLSDPAKAGHYIMIDRWESQAAYEAFLSEWRDQYEAIDKLCKSLMEREVALGAMLSLRQ